MKKTMLLGALLLIGVQMWTNGCRAALPMPPVPGCEYEYGPGCPPGGYRKDAWTVWYRGREVEEASAQSFVDLGFGYGKDNWAVFFEGRKIKEASAQSFAVLSGGYARDNWKVFWCGRELPDADPQSFEVLGRGYARDNWKIWYCGREADGVMPGNPGRLR